MPGGGRGPCACGCPDTCNFYTEFDKQARFMWEETEMGTGTGSDTFSTLMESGWFMLSGDGTATAIANMPASQQAISVSALFGIEPTGGNAGGVVIRRGDSEESIAFLWLGGTSYELYRGSTLLAAFSGPPGEMEIRLELPTASTGTTDINCYAGMYLLHQEIGASFAMPDILNIGLISKGYAAFEWFKASPCPKSCVRTPCDTICEAAFNSLCAEQAANIPTDFDLPMLPVSWEMDIEITGTEGSGNCCSRYGGKIAFLNGEHVRALNYTPYTGPCPDTMPSTWGCGCPVEVWGTDPILTPPNSDGCVWHGVIPSKYAGPDDRNPCYIFADDLVTIVGSWRPPRTPLPPGTFPWWGPGDCTRTDGNDAPDTNPTNTTFYKGIRWMVRVSVQQVGPGTAPSDFEVGVSLKLENMIPGQEATLLSYAATPVALDAVDLINSPTVVSLTGGALTSSPCVIPTAITLTPNGNVTVAREVTQCYDVDICDPPLDPVSQAVYTMTASFEDLMGRVFTEDVTMVAFYNEETASWEWNGSGMGFQHPTCGTIPPSTYRIYCREDGEGDVRRWMISVENSNGTVELPLVMDPELGPSWSGTIDNQCSGEDWESLIDLIALPVAAPFGSCHDTWQPMRLSGNAQYVCFFSPESAQQDIVLTPVSYTTIPSTLPGPISGSVWRGTLNFGHGFHVYVYATSTTEFNVVVTYLDGTLVPSAGSVGTYHCGGANNRPVLEDVFIPTGWGDEPDPTGICSGTFGNAEWGFVWDGFEFY